MPSTSLVLASLIFSSLIRHQRSLCFRRFAGLAPFVVDGRAAEEVVAVGVAGVLGAGLLERLFLTEFESFDTVDRAEAATDFKLIASGSRSLREDESSCTEPRPLTAGDERGIVSVDTWLTLSMEGLEESAIEVGDIRSGVDAFGLGSPDLGTARIRGVDAGLGLTDLAKTLDCWKAFGVAKGVAIFCRRNDS